VVLSGMRLEPPEAMLESARTSVAVDAEEALRRNEESLRLALEAGEMGSFEWNVQTGEIRWSDNLEAIHGLPTGTFVGTFESFQTLIHAEDRPGVLEQIRCCVETGAEYEAEFRSSAHGGPAHWIMGKGKVFADSEGRPSRMMGVCMDITRRKHAEEAIREAERRKDEFLAMISHELRNPLSAITSASELLAGMAFDDPLATRANGVIRRQTEQLTRIVNDLLDISRLTAGKLILRETALDLAALVDRCVKELGGAHALDHHRRELRLVRAPVRGDSVRLEQVVTNLLTNAVKYTPAGGTISVEVEPVGEEAVLRVRDTGIGIAPDLLPRIFDLFVQSERGLDRRDGGLGVGLSIVRQLVEAHGGRVEARSAGTNLGAEIIVRFPLAVAPVERSARSADEARPVRRSVLVVDDNVDAREALASLLERAGHDVHQAEDGPGGLEAVTRLRPDAVLIDIGLPGIDGFELARRLRAGGSMLRLIALTGYGHPDYRRRGAEAGFDAYLVKPVAIDAVLREIGDLGRRSDPR
jgi:PAS domain S-box-containing protein